MVVDKENRKRNASLRVMRTIISWVIAFLCCVLYFLYALDQYVELLTWVSVFVLFVECEQFLHCFFDIELRLDAHLFPPVRDDCLGWSVMSFAETGMAVGERAPTELEGGGRTVHHPALVIAGEGHRRQERG